MGPPPTGGGGLSAAPGGDRPAEPPGSTGPVTGGWCLGLRAARRVPAGSDPPPADRRSVPESAGRRRRADHPAAAARAGDPADRRCSAGSTAHRAAAPDRGLPGPRRVPRKIDFRRRGPEMSTVAKRLMKSPRTARSIRFWPYGNTVAYAMACVEVWSDVGQRLDGRLEVLQVRHQIGLGVVDEPVGGVAERPELGERGGELRPFAVQHFECARNPLQRFVDRRRACSAKVEATRFSASMVATRLCALLIERADERVESGQQVAAVLPRGRTAPALKVWTTSPI